MEETPLYVGKAKELYPIEGSKNFRVHYLDQATALNGQKKDQIAGKGQLNNAITSLIFEYLTNQDIENHFVKKLNDTDQVVQSMTMIPLECVVRNVATGSIVKRLGIEEKTEFEEPVIEFFYKNDDLDDPMINESHISLLKLLSPEQVNEIKEKVRQLNDRLVTLFAKANIRLVDFKVEYGFNENGEIILADEISPDTCRLWDMDTGESLDKDIYRKDLGEIVPIYEEVYRRLKSI